MSTNKPTRGDDPTATTVDVASILSTLHAPFETADAERATSLASLANARTAHGYMMQRVRDGRALVLGNDAPEIAALDATIAANTELAASLAVQSKLAAKPAPLAAADETIVHGYIHDAEGKPAEGVKVSLARPGGDVLASSTSAKDGHYILRHKASPKTDVPYSIEVRVHDKRHPDPIHVERGNGVALVMVHLED